MKTSAQLDREIAAAGNAKLIGTCSVCIRSMQLTRGKPIRHGFSAIGVQHGQSGGYHTGPCSGSSYPHLGISTAGTVHALGQASKSLESVTEALRKLAERPDLVWYRILYNVRGKPRDLANPITLKPGADVPYAHDGRPSYDGEHRRRTSDLVSTRDQIKQAIDTYEKILASWTPEKYPTKGAQAKVETVHLAREISLGDGRRWTGIACRRTRPGYASEKIHKTTHPGEVTCARCKAAKVS